MFESEEKTRAAELLNFLLWGTLIAVLLGMFANAQLPDAQLRILRIMPAVLFQSVLLVLLRSGYVRLVGFLSIAGSWLFYTSILFASGTISRKSRPGN